LSNIAKVRSAIIQVFGCCDCRRDVRAFLLGTGYQLCPCEVFIWFRLAQVLVVRPASGVQSASKEWGLDMSPMRVLVVDDFAPFCQVIRSMLAERSDVQVIGQVADGLEGSESGTTGAGSDPP
jgi:hypothetical protein